LPGKSVIVIAEFATWWATGNQQIFLSLRSTSSCYTCVAQKSTCCRVPKFYASKNLRIMSDFC